MPSSGQALRLRCCLKGLRQARSFISLSVEYVLSLERVAGRVCFALICVGRSRLGRYVAFWWHCEHCSPLNPQEGRLSPPPGTAPFRVYTTVRRCSFCPDSGCRATMTASLSLHNECTSRYHQSFSPLATWVVCVNTTSSPSAISLCRHHC